jgi:hypothetical protein
LFEFFWGGARKPSWLALLGSNFFRELDHHPNKGFLRGISPKVFQFFKITVGVPTMVGKPTLLTKIAHFRRVVFGDELENQVCLLCWGIKKNHTF